MDAPAVRIPCPACGRPLEVAEEGRHRCTWARCGRRFEVLLFPGAARRGSDGIPPPAAGPDGAPCPEHPANRAEAVCARCGAFACRLCRVDLPDRTLCARCFGRLHGAGDLAWTRRGRLRWGALAFVLGLASLLPLWGLPFVAATGVVFALALRARRARPSAAPSMVPLVAGLAIACLSLALHVAVFIAMYRELERARPRARPSRRSLPSGLRVEEVDGELRIRDRTEDGGETFRIKGPAQDMLDRKEEWEGPWRSS